MKEIMQQTLAAPIAYSGIGLHSGKEVAMKLLPGKENTGIVFVRTDLSGHPEIQALAENVSSTVKATTVSENGTEVFTVEHLMAAFSMMGIDNCRIEMSAPEPPVTDGSAAVFCELILQAGRIRQSEPRKIYAVDRAFSVYEDDKYITIQPYDGYRISFVSVNAHPALGTQYFDIELTEEKFLQEIAAARTVGFMSEIKQMQQMGLGLGGSIENVVIFDDDKILSDSQKDAIDEQWDIINDNLKDISNTMADSSDTAEDFVKDVSDQLGTGNITGDIQGIVNVLDEQIQNISDSINTIYNTSKTIRSCSH